MSSDSDSLTQLKGLVPGTEVDLPARGLHWLDERRQSAAQQVANMPWPSRADEAWRYTSMEPLKDKRFVLLMEEVAALELEDIEPLLMPCEGPRLVLVNGRFAAKLSDLADLPMGVQVGGLRQLLEQHPESLQGFLGSLASSDANIFAALNGASMSDGAVILVPDGVKMTPPIDVLHVSVELEEPAMAQPRSLIVLGAEAEAVVIERYGSLGPSTYFTNAVVEIVLDRSAQLIHQRLQEESDNAFHIAGLYLRLGSNSRYACTTAALGAAWSRTEIYIRFAGEGAESLLNGLYFAGDRKLVDFHIDVEHGVPRCRSEESFKGILDGRGVAVFDGRVVVAKDAQKTDAHLANANLMLSRNAEVDTKPQLEIYADDVKCSHGTSVGQLDPDAVFYLRSRGIGEVEARKLLCLGFAGEILEQYRLPQLRERAAQIIRQRLAQAPSALR